MLAILILLLVACTKISNGQPPTNSSLPTVETAPSKRMPTPVLLGDYSLLSPDDMRADLDYLFQILEAAHPNLYMNRPKIEVDADRQRVYAELAQPATIINYYLKVAPLIASLGDRHTFVLLPSNAIGSQELFFPLVVEFHEKRALIVQNFAGVTSIQTGAELLSINGSPVSSVQNDLTRLGFDHDGVSYSMWYLYGSLPEYQLEIISPGEATSVDYTVPGMTSEAIWKVASSIDYPRLNLRNTPR